MTKINVFFPAMDSKAQLARQTDTESQRDNWLRQMEGALLADMNQAGAPYQANPAGAGKERHAAAPQHADHAARMPTPRRAGPADAYPLTPVLAPSESAADATVAPEPAQAQQQAMADAAAPAEASLAQRAPAAEAMLAAAHGLGATTASEQAGSAVPARPLVMPPGVASGAGAGATSEAGEAAVETPHAPADAGQLAEKPVWQKRLMHLTGNGQDVDVWIRDSALGPQQTSSLIQRLAGDIAGMGLRLKGATVNGKPAFRAAAAVPPRAKDLPTEHFHITQPEEDHGT